MLSILLQIFKMIYALLIVNTTNIHDPFNMSGCNRQFYSMIQIDEQQCFKQILGGVINLLCCSQTLISQVFNLLHELKRQSESETDKHCFLPQFVQN